MHGFGLPVPVAAIGAIRGWSCARPIVAMPTDPAFRPRAARGHPERRTRCPRPSGGSRAISERQHAPWPWPCPVAGTCGHRRRSLRGRATVVALRPNTCDPFRWFTSAAVTLTTAGSTRCGCTPPGPSTLGNLTEGPRGPARRRRRMAPSQPVRGDPMSPSQRCDEILRLIDETLRDQLTPRLTGATSGGGATVSGDTWAAQLPPMTTKGGRSPC